MPIELPNLPYHFTDLEPHISEQTLRYHYGKHHAGYVDKLNDLIRHTHFEKMPLEEIVIAAHKQGASAKSIFNNAAQAWNHSFLWKCMTPDSAGQPSSGFVDSLLLSFDSFEGFQEEFERQAIEYFGSGWIWLIKNDDDTLTIETTKDAETPIAHGRLPILTCDLWEHAYYLDYQNERVKYVQSFMQLIDWEFVEQNYENGRYPIPRENANRRRPKLNRTGDSSRESPRASA